MNDRECDQCTYNLRGLPEGGKCPECGTSIRRIISRISGTMSNEAPSHYIRKLRLGFMLCSVGILSNLILSGLGLMFLSSLFWVAGVWLTTDARPNRGKIVPDAVLDNDRLRHIIRAMNAAWPIYGLLILSIMMGGAKASAIVSVPLIGLMMIAGAISWLALVPTCVYFAELGYWASHDHLAQRLRSTAWAMAVFGVLSMLLTSIALMGGPGGGAAGFVGLWMYLLVVIAVVVFFFTVIQLGLVMHWVIKHQTLSAGSADRVRDRIERSITSHGTIVTGLKCRECRYDLDGLPYGGCCPECGESYADLTPIPILDPANMYTDRDESEIEIEEGENKGIYFNKELDAYGKPKATGVPFTPDQNIVPDEGDIPLSDADPQE